MGQKIWAVLEEYAGRWVAVDKSGKVVDSAEELVELTRRAKGRGLTLVFAARTEGAAAA